MLCRLYRQNFCPRASLDWPKFQVTGSGEIEKSRAESQQQEAG